MKILIIGATSTLAKAAAKALREENEIITAGRHDCDIYCDVTENVIVPEEVDAVINFATSFKSETDRDIIEIEKTNVQGTLNVCVASKKAGVKHIILISSIFALLDKESPHYSFYSITKRHADEMAEFYCKVNKIPLTIIRPSQVYGDSDDFAKQQPFFYSIIDKAQQGQDISLYGSNDALRNFIHIVDLTEILKKIVLGKVEGIFTCMSPTDVSYSSIAKTAQKIFGQGGQVAFLKDRPDIPDNIFEEDLTIYKKLGYSPQISMESGLDRIKKYRESQ